MRELPAEKSEPTTPRKFGSVFRTLVDIIDEILSAAFPVLVWLINAVGFIVFYLLQHR